MDTRYPVGRFVFDRDVTPAKRRGWIREFAALPGQVTGAVGRLGPGGLDTPYRAGGWTARQVVHHLADSHVNAYTRIRLALTEDAPAIKTYDEQRWAELPDARQGDPSVSLAVLDGLHQRLVVLFDSLTLEQFARTAAHPEWGEVSVDFLLQSYAWHGRHHVAHLELAGAAWRRASRDER